ncbi:MAG: tRNA (adenosine(37)-N6)-dimethylallyltransferase MiaA [Bacteroidota bacterium]
MTGPTAAGKTALAIRIAKLFSCEILSADSRQFFRELKIGTAPPSDSELNEIKHHFIHSHSIHDVMDVSTYETIALAKLNELWKSFKYTVLVGGSGLYVQSVCKGLDSLPDADPVVRNELNQIFETKGISELRLMLKKLDPEYYNDVDIANPKRLLRALEVCISTGIPFSSFRKNEAAPRMFNIIKLGLTIDRYRLHQIINKRVDSMMESGLLEEATTLFPQRQLNALNTVGYRELFDFFEGKCSKEDAIEKIKTNTRRFARRQMTWFNKDKEIKWLNAENKETCFIETIKYLRLCGCDIPSNPA